MTRARLVLTISLVAIGGTAACGRPARPGWWLAGARAPAVEVPAAAVTSGSPIASDVGVAILRAGGNAVDAAVAVGFALAVVLPEAGNIGGGGFMVIRLATGDVVAIDYREMAPAGVTRDMYVGPGGRLTTAGVIGHLAAGVPGSVAGMIAAHERFGRRPLAEVMAPAIALARDGFVLDDYRARSIAGAADRLSRFAASSAQFLVNGRAPAAGSTLVQRDLAHTLQAIADSGPRGFYHGWVADSIVAEMERGAGLITHADLAAYRAKWREPIVFTYRGHTVYSMPPASSGGVTLALILNILEGFDPLPRYGTPDQVHLMAEAMRRAYVDRNHYLGDPDFVHMPIAQLIGDAYAAERRSTIARDRATTSSALAPGADESEQTTHYSVVDAEGNAVSVTTTLNSGYGSKVTVAGAGFLLNNEMDDFTSAPGQPNLYGLVQGEANAIVPRKRMLSAMTPTIVLAPDGELMLVVGTPGGATIITTVAQVVSNIIDHGMSLPAAVAAPRIHHQHLPDHIRYERQGLRASTLARLRDMGHALEERSFHGDVAAIGVTPTGLIAVADHRRGGGVSGY